MKSSISINFEVNISICEKKIVSSSNGCVCERERDGERKEKENGRERKERERMGNI